MTTANKLRSRLHRGAALTALALAVGVAAPAWREDLALAAALRLERAGVVAAHRPPEPAQ